MKVQGGDVLGKTIVFAKNQDHAEFIAQRFNAQYPKYRGEFARVITFKTEYAQHLIDNFSNPGRLPNIAISVVNVDNFVVRPKRRLVERFCAPLAWTSIGRSDRLELASQVAGLPTELPSEREEAKRFDLLLLRLQLAMLRHETRFESLRDEVKSLAGRLEEKSAIPMVQAQLALIHDVQSDEWWQDATLPMLESVRRRLRDLVQFIERRHQKPIYTDFEDEMGSERAVHLPGFGATHDFERFRDKARRFLRQHHDHVAIHKLRANKPLNAADLEELQRILGESGAGGSPRGSGASGRRVRGSRRVRPFTGWLGPRGRETGAVGVHVGTSAVGESTRVRGSHREPPDGARRVGGGPALQRALHEHHASGTRVDLQRGRDRRAAECAGAGSRYGPGGVTRRTEVW